MYNEDNYLQLSGLQHYLFCPRQWALIHIENQWQENLRTVDGALMHSNVHQEGSVEKRKDKLTVRGMRIASPDLGVSGQCDAVEFLRDEKGISLPGYEGRWMPVPVEYKHGSPKEDLCDVAQLCGQAMCLEEMLCCSIEAGALYYGETRRRQAVTFTPELRQTVREALERMHELYARGHTPSAKPKKGCNACSLKDICRPRLQKSGTVAAYLKKNLEDTL